MVHMINIEVAFAADDKKQVVLPLEVQAGCTVQAAIEQSGILAQFPMLDLAVNKVGVFSKTVALDAVLQAGDRVEIYRPLLIDPKQARQLRAHKQKQN